MEVPTRADSWGCRLPFPISLLPACVRAYKGFLFKLGDAGEDTLACTVNGNGSNTLTASIYSHPETGTITGTASVVLGTETSPGLFGGTFTHPGNPPFQGKVMAASVGGRYMIFTIGAIGSPARPYSLFLVQD